MHEKIYRAFNSDIMDYTFDEADALKEELLSLQPFSADEQDGLNCYMEDFLVRFVHASNAIEGSTLSIKDTALVIDGEFKPSEDNTFQEIFAAKGCADGFDFVQYALENNRTLSEDLIKDIHEKTALDCQPRVRGTYRVVPVYLRGSSATPVAAEKIRELMPTLLYANENSSAHPLGKVAAFHAMFENIHPFRDCNGRTGRLLMNFMLQKEGYPPIAIKHDAGAEYKNALEDWQVNDNPSSFLSIIQSSVVAETQRRIDIVKSTRKLVDETD